MTAIKFISENLKDEWFDSYTWSVITYPKGLTPADYLKFAEMDLGDGGEQRHLINAISNAKRALHLEVETMCDAFGLQSSSKKAKNFPQKLEFISRLGVVRERLLRKMNDLRNLIEHEYYSPSKAEAEDFIDVVTLFVDAMKLNRMRYPTDIDLCEAFDDSGKFQAISLKSDLEKGVITLKIVIAGDYRGEATFNKITVDDSDYPRWNISILKNNGQWSRQKIA